ncbi:hypothetical protein [Nocardiopsis sp. FIRDI 009]|uniref:hypothetical protein n=1 Tax=Nocardiopsis sp. FIRDI 009 TaxID=714197 RepID=UPI000E244108|nr:hypothetical protein [Nocardiopsis sp. FIRDI 009]
MKERQSTTPAALTALRRLHPAWTISAAEDGYVARHTNPETGDTDDIIRADTAETLGSRLHATQHRR